MSHFPRTVVPVTILSGASLSGAGYIGLGRLVGIEMPATWTTATLTFQGANDDAATYRNVYDGTGSETEFQAAASRLITVDEYGGATWVKIRSGTSGSPVNQNADRILNLIVEKRTFGAS